ncbi:hypothetical protein AJ80_08708 [Polytolypa hystricis UAMH7299]|uniref:Exocyst complex component Sec8 n=1 Tax=Polytolypa hystricis (strain UAMH7299) TaxID=1447883 RepID=A0A2B7X3U0_POLH7|nr:hypothetical protein AJ80_08708 [Polytolypa hystricis UAMH7299]
MNSSRPGFPNGNPSTGRSDREYGQYTLDNSSTPSMSNGYPAAVGAARERRAGGYGGFYDNPAASSTSLQSAGSDQYLRPQTSRSRGGRDGDGGSTWGSGSVSGGGASNGRYDSPDRRERNRSAGSGSMRTGDSGGTGLQEIDDVLRLIQSEWDFMAIDDCIPVQVGLQLMDSSTLGKADREPDFLRTRNQIQRALKSIVNEHHQGFNSSIGTYHKIQSSIHSSQTRIRTLRSTLTEAKAGLLTTKPELKGLATASQSYDDILQLFGQIENIQSLPEKLEARISEKRFISAVEILQDALRLVRRSELDGIGGLGDLRTYFSNQESSLTDILIEELHDHLYLKSPYCQERWKAAAGEDGKGAPNRFGVNGIASWEKPIYRFLSTLDVTAPLVEDASRNPEADTFYYLYMIIEALNKMGNLDTVIDRIEHRLPVELFSVVDKTSSEIAARHPNHTRGVAAREGQSGGVSTDLVGEQGYVLSEFLWNLYAKFEAIAEGHRVVHDVVSGIVEREGIRNSSTLTGGFKELWKLYQSEIRSLLHDYLATDGETTYRSPVSPSNNAYTTSMHRDKTKKMFKLSEVDPDMKAAQDDLDEILRSSVPGLVSKSREQASTADASRSRQENSGTGHKLLIEPSVFNISLLLPPSLAFIQRIKDIVPVTSDIVMSTLTSFLDDFLINVFQPQLDEAVTELSTMSFIALDAFTEDPQWSTVSHRPVFKGTISFMKLVKMFSKMLDSIPHDQIFTQLIIAQIVTYYDKCCGWYKALVTRMSPQAASGVRLKAAAAFAESGEIRDVVKELWESPGGKRHDFINKEIELLIKRTNETPLESYDIVSDPKTVFSLSLLYNSMQWLVSSLRRLRHITPHQTDSSKPQAGRNAHSRRWTLLTATKSNRDSISQPIYLPMTHETVIAFDTTLESLQNLALTSLITLHIDIRCGAIHMVTRSLAGSNNNNNASQPQTPTPDSTTGNWAHILSNPPTSASPTILELSNDIIAFDANISTYLGHMERRFITSGLAKLIDRAFVSGTRFIGAMNTNGAQRLQLDVLVIQQNLKNVIITKDPDKISSNNNNDNNRTPPHEELVALPQSAKFLDWFLDGPDKALSYAKEEKEKFKTVESSPSSSSDPAAAAAALSALSESDGDPFTYDEMKVLVELCFSAVLRDARGAQMASREDYIAAKRGSGEALLRLSEVMWDS